MSNDLAIATVTATLKRVLENAVVGEVTGIAMSVTVGQPDPKDAVEDDKGKVNIFLYQATANPGWRNADLPSRRADGSVGQRPQLALDLHYLLSFYGDKKKLVPERLMGLVMKTLHAQPFLPRQKIQDTVERSERNTEYSFLQGSNLAEQPELVKFSPVSLSLEDLSKIWSIFFQTQYVLSTAYQGSVVLIESDDDLVESLPVSDRTIEVAATPPPVSDLPPTITQIRSEAGAAEVLTPGSRMLIQGRELAKRDIEFIQLDDQRLTPTQDNIRNTEIILPLSASLSVGVKKVQIVYAEGLRSNQAEVRIHPAGDESS